jgi:uncharacterized protein (TIGR02301 family)
MRPRAAAAAVALLVLAASGAVAQPAAPPPAAPAAPVEETPPAYEPQLLRLAEIMGSLALLRDLCGAGDGEDWRRRMGALIEAESTTPQRRDRLAGAWNRGFRHFETIYRVCTPAAERLIARYVEEGARIARDLGSRYGG